jgi:hypothetical protein
MTYQLSFGGSSSILLAFVLPFPKGRMLQPQKLRPLATIQHHTSEQDIVHTNGNEDRSNKCNS